MVTRVSFADCEDSVTEWADEAGPASVLLRAVATAEWENDAPHAGAWLEFR